MDEKPWDGEGDHRDAGSAAVSELVERAVAGAPPATPEQIEAVRRLLPPPRTGEVEALEGVER